MALKRNRRYCSVYGCFNNTLNSKMSFFSVPPDQERRLQWLKLIDREDLTDKHIVDLRVCEVHFRPEHISPNSNRRRVKKYCLPSVNLPNSKRVTEDKDIQTDVNTSQRFLPTWSVSCQTQKGSVATSSCSGDSNQAPDLLSEIPEAIVLISRVYHYLQEEYEQLKCVTDCDVRSLSDVLTRTARATGLSALTVTRVLELEKRTHDDDDVMCKRQKITHDYYDCNSPIKEEPEEEQEQDSEQCEIERTDNVPTAVAAQQTEQRALQIQFKTDPDNGQTEQLVVYHSEEDEQDRDPLREEINEAQSAVAAICGSSTSDVDIKIEPPDMDHTPSSFSTRPSATSDVIGDVIKIEPSDENHFTI